MARKSRTVHDSTQHDSTQHDSTRPAHELRCYIDYGTKTLSAAYALVPEGTDTSSHDFIDILMLQGKSEEIAQMVGYIRDDRGRLVFTWGAELNEAVEARSNKVVATFEHLKYVLFASEEEAERKKRRMEDKLAKLKMPEKTVEDLFVKHIKCFMQEWGIRVKKRGIITDVLSYKTRLFFPVPEIVDPGATQRLIGLLREAECPELRLVSETEAAGAWAVFRELRKMLRHDILNPFRPGDKICVVDGGGWTVNSAEYQLRSDAGEGVQMLLKSTGKKCSEPLGSEVMISFPAVRLMRKSIDDKTWKQFNMEESDFEQQAMSGVESCKATSHTPRDWHINIKGKRLRANQPPFDKNFTITGKQREALMDRLFKRICSAIDANTSKDFRHIVLCGGLMRSNDLVNRLIDHYTDECGVRVIMASKDGHGDPSHAVLRGVAARFSIEHATVPATFELGVTQDEEFDRSVHENLPTRNRCKYYADSRTYAPNRWRILVPYGTMISSSRSLTTEIFLDYVFDEKDLDVNGTHYTWTKAVYWTESHIEEHSATTKLNGHHIRKFKVWRMVTISILREEVEKYDMIDNGYRVSLRLRAKIEGPNVDLFVHRPNPRYHFYPGANEREDEELSYWVPPPANKWIEVPLVEADRKLHDENYSAFVLRHEGSEEVRSEPDVPSSASSATKRGGEYDDDEAGPRKRAKVAYDDSSTTSWSSSSVRPSRGQGGGRVATSRHG